MSVENPLPTALGTRWLHFWTYAGLPVVAVVALLFSFGEMEFLLEFFPVTLLCIAVAIGLKRRKAWAWQWNWVVVVVIFVGLLIPVPVRDTHVGIAQTLAQGLIQLTSIRWVRDSLGDMAGPIAIRLVLASLLWAWPNWRYWKKREALFS